MKVLDGCCLWLPKGELCSNAGWCQTVVVIESVKGEIQKGEDSRARPDRALPPGCGGLILAMRNDREQHIRYVALCSLISVLISNQPWTSNTDQCLDIKIGQYESIDCK